MTSADRVDPDRLATLVVGRAHVRAKRPERAEAIATATYRFAPATDTRPAWQARVGTVVDLLTRAGTLSSSGALADRSDLARRIGAFRVRDWHAFASRALPAIALDLTPALASKLADGSAWLGAIAGRVLDLWPASGSPPSLSSIGDALVWRQLGLAGKPRRCPPEVRAAFVRRQLPTDVTTTGYEPLVRLHAAHALGAARSDLSALRDALVRRWLVDAAPSTVALADDARFVAAVDELAHHHELARFGDDKVYIAAVHAALRAQPSFADLALVDFKHRLLAAHQSGAIALARADLVAAMDPGLVAASETIADGARFHFIVKDSA